MNFMSVDYKLEIAMQALEDIADPVGAIKRKMNPEERLNGPMAISLSQNHNYLKGIAREALYKIDPHLTKGESK